MGDFDTQVGGDDQGAVGQDGGWRARPLILAALGLVAAIIVQQLINTYFAAHYMPAGTAPPPVWRDALAMAVAAFAIVVGFSAERTRIRWAIGFAASVGVVAGLILYWNGEPGGKFFGEWRGVGLMLSVAILLPLFQTARDEGVLKFPYVDVHGHAWTNVVLWFASWIFVGVVFALTYLLSSLFELIGLTFLKQLLEMGWFQAGLLGAALGGALGLLRERDRVVRLLQRVVTAVLGVLAPVLGIGLLVFLVSLPFTGLGTLWDATRSTTPILLGCVIGALILSNAVIGNGADEESRNPVLRWAAMALALAILPLTVIAAIATGLRISQYGLTPDRLWALTFVVLASAYGLTYIVSLARGRMNWAAYVRPANLNLAFGVAGIALFLATPILSFNALSTRDQIARLESGRTPSDKFDWAALAYDFGEPGKAALRRLSASADPKIRENAIAAAKSKTRWDMETAAKRQQARDAETIAKTAPIQVRPTAVEVPLALRHAIFGVRVGRFDMVSWAACDPASKNICELFWKPDENVAVVVQDRCRRFAERQDKRDYGCDIEPVAFVRINGRWVGADRSDTSSSEPTSDQLHADRKAQWAAIDRGDITIRNVPRRQVFIGGKPVGDVFE